MNPPNARKVKIIDFPDAKVVVNPKCHKCYGRGYIGRRVEDGEKVKCSCTQIIGKITKEKEDGTH